MRGRQSLRLVREAESRLMISIAQTRPIGRDRLWWRVVQVASVVAWWAAYAFWGG